MSEQFYEDYKNQCISLNNKQIKLFEDRLKTLKIIELRLKIIIEKFERLAKIEERLRASNFIDYKTSNLCVVVQKHTGDEGRRKLIGKFKYSEGRLSLKKQNKNKGFVEYSLTRDIVEVYDLDNNYKCIYENPCLMNLTYLEVMAKATSLLGKNTNLESAQTMLKNTQKQIAFCNDYIKICAGCNEKAEKKYRETTGTNKIEDITRE